MILEIKLTNFFSIDKEITLDLRAGNINTHKTKELASNVTIWNQTKILKTVAIYGANASGKSNIIKAIRFACELIIQSHLLNEDTIFNFKPFKFNKKEKQSTFFIRFVVEQIEYEYSFSLTKEQIKKESLYFYPNGRRAKIFERNEDKGTAKKEKYSFTQVIKRPFEVARNTSNKTLFISRASQMDRKIGKLLFNFFHKKFILGYLTHDNKTIQTNLVSNKKFILNALQIADSDIVDIQFEKEENTPDPDYNNFMVSGYEVRESRASYGYKLRLISYHKSAPNIPFDFQTEESEGTKKLFYILLNVLDVIQNDKILLVDELETSLHTSIVEFVVDLFHGKGQSQLIYSTHNTNLLNLNKVRKDQIYFVNKNEKGASELYSLYDYKDFRENMDVEKGYLQGRFDAVPFIGDTELILETLENG